MMLSWKFLAYLVQQIQGGALKLPPRYCKGQNSLRGIGLNLPLELPGGGGGGGNAWN